MMDHPSPGGADARSQAISDVESLLAGYLRDTGAAQLGINVEAVGLRFSAHSAVLIDGAWHADAVPPPLIQAVVGLRAAMADPSRGAWTCARLELATPDDRLSMEVDYNRAPVLAPPMTPDDVAQELRRFPREATAVPEWMRPGMVIAETPGARGMAAVPGAPMVAPARPRPPRVGALWRWAWRTFARHPLMAAIPLSGGVVVVGTPRLVNAVLDGDAAAFVSVISALVIIALTITACDWAALRAARPGDPRWARRLLPLQPVRTALLTILLVPGYIVAFVVGLVPLFVTLFFFQAAPVVCMEGRGGVRSSLRISFRTMQDAGGVAALCVVLWALTWILGVTIIVPLLLMPVASLMTVGLYLALTDRPIA
ncbi:hypothetical protein [Actinomyces gaoshouyii]|uniref:hypothetical protein n=1 Tax=Actinomyces gaoshouyii TaxID=1960083 RepID=UPI0009BE899B|nr:hypothetical protein [Actinomyces gaoshouyii]ARD42547.1 hypothetical protein B6G06_09490 [Actinomyces gaoshouyii]